MSNTERTAPAPESATAPLELHELNTPCPDFCTLPAGHQVDALHPDGRRSRTHGDVRFGKFLLGVADEFTAYPGVLEFSVQINGDGVDLRRPEELFKLARKAIAAGEWLQEQQQRASERNAFELGRDAERFNL